jgi:hypothetical protein
VDAGHVDVAIMEDAEEATALATTVVVVTVAAAMHVVEVAEAVEAAMTATWLHARSVTNQAMKPGSVGTATPKTKKKKRRKKRVPMLCPMAWTQIGTVTPAPQTTSPVSSTSSP